jgi:hypothetical protein
MAVIRFLFHALVPAMLAGSSLLLVTGCNIASAVGYAVHPEPEFEAQYELADVPTVRRGCVG